MANTQRLIDAYTAAGVNVMFPTVDQQASNYERTNQDRNLGGRVRAVGAGARAAQPPAAPTGSAKYRINGGRLWYTWDYIDAVRKMIKGKMLIKGIVGPEDASLAIEHGVDGIIVSNHGGRSMDYGPSTLEVLPEIVAAVNGRVPIIFDSGIRRGADIFKALALGGQRRDGRTGDAVGPCGLWHPRRTARDRVAAAGACPDGRAAGCAKLSDINKTMVKPHFV